MTKKVIRLTEGELKSIVRNSVRRVIREMSGDDWDEHEFYNKYGNQSQYPAYDYIEPSDGELGMTAQYDNDDIDVAMMDDPEYFLDGREDIYRSKMPGDYRTKRL